MEYIRNEDLGSIPVCLFKWFLPPSKIYIYIYLFLAALGFQCCTRFSLVTASKGYSIVGVLRLLTAVASCCRTQVLGYAGFSTYSFGALDHRLSRCGT